MTVILKHNPLILNSPIKILRPRQNIRAAMAKYALSLITYSFLFTASVASARDLSVQDWLDLFIESCVGSGSSAYVSGSVNAGLGLSLKTFSANGSVSGQVEVTKSTYRLLSEGISNAMTKIAADQADKVRDCLRPLRRNLLLAMNRQLNPTEVVLHPTVHFLSPYEERIMMVLAKNKGLRGKTGKYVPTTVILQKTKLSDIRFRVTMRMLESKRLATVTKFLTSVVVDRFPKSEIVDVVTLYDSGEEYVLQMRYVE